MPLKRVNKFNDLWLKMEKCKPWLERHPTSEVYALCKSCKVDIHLGSIGIGAKGKKHASLLLSDSPLIGIFFKKSTTVRQTQVC